MRDWTSLLVQMISIDELMQIRIPPRETVRREEALVIH